MMGQGQKTKDKTIHKLFPVLIFEDGGVDGFQMLCWDDYARNSILLQYVQLKHCSCGLEGAEPK